jgi:protein-tyrosine-phosphatase
MAKVILEQILVSRGLSDQISVDSAAVGDPSLAMATEEARKVIKEMFSQDFLVSHKSKSIGQIDIC